MLVYMGKRLYLCNNTVLTFHYPTAMKKLLLFAYICAAAIGVTTGCRFAHEDPLGDTVAASVFAPEDTAAIKKKQKAKIAAIVKDSAGVFYIGSGSDRQTLQLVSYPSRRDTFCYGKTAHIKVEGSADTGRVVKVAFYVMASGDLLVSKVMEKSDEKRE